jgi:type IV secretion system protein VirD4
MYLISRLLLIVAAAVGVAVCLPLLFALFWPLSGMVVAVAALCLATRTVRRRWTTLGSARWADEADLRHAGMLDDPEARRGRSLPPTGLPLGTLVEPGSGRRGRRRSPGELPASVAQLLLPWVRSDDACRGVRAALCLPSPPPPRVRLSASTVHTAVFSPSGGGKGVSCVVPFLLGCPDPCVVLDLKGENATLTAAHRRRAFGHRVALLDPFKVVTPTPDSLNPLDGVGAYDPLAVDHCNALAKALVVRGPDEREPHWSDSAEAWIASLLATVARYGEPAKGTRSLLTVREIAADPAKLEKAVALMRGSDAWDGVLARLGGQLSHYVDKERSSTLTTVSRHLRFLDTLAVGESVGRSTFDPADLRRGALSAFLVLPPEHLRAQSGLIRLWVGSLLRAVVAGGLREDHARGGTPAPRVHFVLDEAASLGHLEAVDDAVDKYRGYGVRLQFYYQSPGQLKACFPNGQDQTLLGNVTQVYFGVNDHATADQVSARLGEETVVVASGGTTDGWSRQWSDGAQGNQSTTSSGGSSSNWQLQPRKLLKPEEVAALPPRVAVTFAPGVPPVMTRLGRYYEEPATGRPSAWRRFLAGLGTLGMSAVLCAAAVGLAAALRQETLHRVARPPRSPAAYPPPASRAPDGTSVTPEARPAVADAPPTDRAADTDAVSAHPPRTE